MSGILQGTTPFFVCEIPEEIAVDTLTAIELTIRNNGVMYIYHLADLILDSEENTINRLFTEEETLALDPDSPFYWQLRVRTPDGMIYGTPRSRFEILDLMSKEMIK